MNFFERLLWKPFSNCVYDHSTTPKMAGYLRFDLVGRKVSKDRLSTELLCELVEEAVRQAAMEICSKPRYGQVWLKLEGIEDDVVRYLEGDTEIESGTREILDRYSSLEDL
jgi:hypothetical protein